MTDNIRPVRPFSPMITITVGPIGDYPTIAGACAWAAETDEADEIIVSGETYVENVIVPANVTIRAATGETVIWKPNTAATTAVATLSGQNEINGITFDITDGSDIPLGFNAIAAVGSGTSYIDDLTVSNCVIKKSASEGLSFQYCSNVHLTNNDFIDNANSGADLINCLEVAVDGCDFLHQDVALTAGLGLKFDGTNNFTVTGSHFQPAAAGDGLMIGLWVIGGSTGTLRDDTFQNSPTADVMLSGTSAIVVDDCHFSNDLTGVSTTKALLVSGSTNVALSNSQLSGYREEAVRYEYYDVAATPSLTLTGNQFSNNSYAVVGMAGNVVMTDNVFDGAGASGAMGLAFMGGQIYGRRNSFANMATAIEVSSFVGTPDFGNDQAGDPGYNQFATTVSQVLNYLDDSPSAALIPFESNFYNTINSTTIAEKFGGNPARINWQPFLRSLTDWYWAEPTPLAPEGGFSVSVSGPEPQFIYDYHQGEAGQDTFWLFTPDSSFYQRITLQPMVMFSLPESSYYYTDDEDSTMNALFKFKIEGDSSTAPNLAGNLEVCASDSSLATAEQKNLLNWWKDYFVNHTGITERTGRNQPNSFKISNHPNPFNFGTTISYALPARAQVKVEIFDVTGRLVRTLKEESQDQGSHQVYWDGQKNGGGPAPTAVYFCRISAGDQVASRRLVKVD